jgi:hypothetical protein
MHDPHDGDRPTSRRAEENQIVTKGRAAKTGADFESRGSGTGSIRDPLEPDVNVVQPFQRGIDASATFGDPIRDPFDVRLCERVLRTRERLMMPFSCA